MNKTTKKIIALVAVLVVGIVATAIGVNTNINIESTEEGYEASIQFSEEQVPATAVEGLDDVEYGQGEVKFEGEDIPTVESVDSASQQVNPEDEESVECPEGEECGRGANYPYVDTSTPQAFLNATMGGCYNVDGYYYEQCWDYAALFFLNYAGRTFSTCGTGAAKGAIADGCWQKNAGGEFTMIWDATQLQAGDIVVFNNGTFGHVGTAAGDYNDGYILLAGQNQGGGLCAGSTMGAKVNLINISLQYFAGAFRPNTYIKVEPEPEPTPEPEISTCQVREVQAGDTLGAIMQECRGEVEWGAAMDEYASHWYSTKFQFFLTIYDGWASTGGVGLFAGDTIEYRAEGQ